MRKKIVYNLMAVILCFCMVGCSKEETRPENVIIETEREVNDNADELERMEDIESEELETSFWLHYIDCGQADAALIQCDSKYMLIDGGNKADSRLIFSVMNDYSIDSFDMIIGTHAHEDHIGGIPAALTYASSSNTLFPVEYDDSEHFKDFLKYALLRGNGITIPEVGDVYELGTATVEILGLNAGGEDVNDSSIVCKITYGETTFLFTGDATQVAEQVLIESGTDLSATVLKVGHHGSGSSTGEDFLNKVNPEIAIISVGTDNEYGHPAKEVLERLQRAGTVIYRTDKNGDVFIRSDGKNVSVAVEKQASEEELLEPGEVYPTEEKVPENRENESQEMEYVANKNSLKLHYPECESVKEMNEKNKIYLKGERTEILSQGYEPCGFCRP